MKWEIGYGSGNEVKQSFPSGTSFGCVINNTHVRGILGYGKSVECFVGGIPQNESTCPQGGENEVIRVKIHDKQCEKATA